MTVELGAEFRIAHCAPISFRPTRDSPSRLLPSAGSFTVAIDLLPSGKKSATATHSTPHSSLEVAAPQRVNFEWERGELPWRGGQTEIGGPSLITVDLGADFRNTQCAPISFGPTRCSPSLLLPSAVSFTVATDLLPSGKKSAAVAHSARHSSLEVAAPTGNFEREGGELPGGTVL
jgi:hypothetical protein